MAGYGPKIKPNGYWKSASTRHILQDLWQLDLSYEELAREFDSDIDTLRHAVYWARQDGWDLPDHWRVNTDRIQFANGTDELPPPADRVVACRVIKLA